MYDLLTIGNLDIKKIFETNPDLGIQYLTLINDATEMNKKECDFTYITNNNFYNGGKVVNNILLKNGIVIAVSQYIEYYKCEETGELILFDENYVKKCNELISHFEIYNVCVGKKYRGQKILSHLFKNLPKNSWLGLKLNNPYFNSALKGYISLGFGNPELTNKNSLGTIITNTELFISLIYPAKITGQSAINEAIMLKNKIYIPEYIYIDNNQKLLPKELQKISENNANNNFDTVLLKYTDNAIYSNNIDNKIVEIFVKNIDISFIKLFLNQIKNSQVKVLLYLDPMILDSYLNKELAIEKFQLPLLTYKTYSGINLKTRHIQLFLNLDENKRLIIDPDITIKDLDDLVNNPYPNVLDYYISMETCNFLKDYLQESVEYGGLFELNDLNELKAIEIVRGEFDTVNVPNGKYYFHTHPEICYKNYGCYVGWPSGQDFFGTLYRYLNYSDLLSLVITKEGIYAITIHPDFMYLIKKLTTKCKTKLMDINLFKNLFKWNEYSHNKYCDIFNEYLNQECQTLIFKNYVEFVNKFSIKIIAEQVFDCFGSEYSDTPIYQLHFQNWADIENNGKFFGKIYIN